MQSVKNKRLYEEAIVREIAEAAIVKVIKDKIAVSDVNDYLNKNFKEIINGIIKRTESE